MIFSSMRRFLPVLFFGTVDAGADGRYLYQVDLSVAVIEQLPPYGISLTTG